MSHIIGNRNSTPGISAESLRPPQRASMGPGHHLRASADMGGAFSAMSAANRSIRPASEIYYNPLQPPHTPGIPEDSADRAAQQWIADIDQYENTLEEMAAAALDQDFKDELSAIEQWFCVLSEAERTAALYALLRQTTQIQIRFFIGVLQQMSKTHPASSVLTPANFAEKDPMSSRLSTAMNKLSVEGNRNSFGPSRTGTSLGANKRLSGLDPDEINSMFPDAAAAIARQKAEFSQAAVASNRNSMLLNDRSSMMPPPSISAPHDDLQNDGFAQPMPSPWGPRSESQPSNLRPKSSSSQQPMGQFSQPPLSAGLRSPRPVQHASDNNIQNTTVSAPNNMGMSDLLSPYVPGASWASMVNTPMNPTFSTQQNANHVDMVANATAMKLAALSTVNNRIQLDDVRKYRRARSSDDPQPAGGSGMDATTLPSNFIMTNENGQILTPQQVAVLQAQQLASINGGQRSRPASPAVSMHSMHSRGLSGSHLSQYGGNGFLSAYDGGLPGTNGGMAGMNLNQYSSFGGTSEGYLSDASELNRGRSPRGKRGSSRPPEDPTDIELLKDIPAWLRSLRLHKYTENFKGMRWQDLVMLDDAGLERMGVNALGARRKLTKVFEQVRELQGLDK